MTMRRLYAAAALALGMAAAVAIPYAYAAGSFSQWPVVGGAADSSGLVTIPAGPTATTGAEVVPADTLNAAGAPPQTVRVPILLLGGAPWVFETHPTTASTTIVSNNVGGLFVQTGAGNTAGAAKVGLNVQMPSAPIDNQRFWLGVGQSTTVIAISPNTGQSIRSIGNPLVLTLSPTNATTTAGAASITLVYRLADTTWYRVQ